MATKRRYKRRTYRKKKRTQKRRVREGGFPNIFRSNTPSVNKTGHMNINTDANKNNQQVISSNQIKCDNATSIAYSEECKNQFIGHESDKCKNASSELTAYCNK